MNIKIGTFSKIIYTDFISVKSNVLSINIGPYPMNHHRAVASHKRLLELEITQIEPLMKQIKRKIR